MSATTLRSLRLAAVDTRRAWHRYDTVGTTVRLDDLAIAAADYGQAVRSAPRLVLAGHLAGLAFRLLTGGCAVRYDEFRTETTKGEPMPDVKSINQEQADRERSLYTALRLVLGDDRWGAGDVMEFAEYVRTGQQPVYPHQFVNSGLPLEVT